MALNKAIAALALRATESFTREELLQELADVAAEHLDVDGVGVMVVQGDASRFVHSTGAEVAQIERVQELVQAGPCRAAIDAGHEVVIDDLSDCSNTDWEPYVSTALAAGLHATVALPLVSRGRSWGVLDVYRTQPTTWDEGVLEAGRLLANVAVSYLVMAADREEVDRAHLELEHRATHDALTGLPNRVLAFDRLEHALELGRRHLRQVAVFFIDLDGFKKVNDTFGHEAGDEVLATVAGRLKDALRRSDSVARIGGDEFVMILEDLEGLDVARLRGELDEIAEQLHRELEQPIRIGDREVVVTASIGVAVAGEGSAPDDVVAAADADMYEMKRGRRQVQPDADGGSEAVDYGDSTAPGSSRQ